MLERISRALLLFGSFLPGAIREILRDVGKELDQLRAEMQETRSKLQQLERIQDASMGKRESEG